MRVDIMLGIVALAVLAAALLLVRRGGGGPAVEAKALLTRAETAFMGKLVAAARDAGLHVCPQVSMGAVMRARKGLDASAAATTRNRFSSKIIDFVLMDASGRVALLVELDDPTHDRDKDRARDAMTSAAGHRTLRIADGRAVDAAQIAAMIARARAA